jgi:hypothetical protein
MPSVTSFTPEFIAAFVRPLMKKGFTLGEAMGLMYHAGFDGYDAEHAAKAAERFITAMYAVKAALDLVEDPDA